MVIIIVSAVPWDVEGQGLVTTPLLFLSLWWFISCVRESVSNFEMYLHHHLLILHFFLCVYAGVQALLLAQCGERRGRQGEAGEFCQLLRRHHF